MCTRGKHLFVFPRSETSSTPGQSLHCYSVDPVENLCEGAHLVVIKLDLNHYQMISQPDSRPGALFPFKLFTLSSPESGSVPGFNFLASYFNQGRKR